MGRYDDDFFEGKRVWSHIKDQVLLSYLPAYISKVKRLKKTIVLIDGYAGPGIFEDGSHGSPMIICSAAEQYAKGQYLAFFLNIKESFHTKLQDEINRAGWSHSAHALQGNSLKYVKQIPGILRDSTVFLYLDPFGIKGCGFDQLKPFLLRDPSYSTEIVLTICMPVLHRLASYKAVKEGRSTDHIISTYHDLLTTILGDESWKDFMLQDIDPEIKENKFIEAYLPHSAV